MHLSQMTKSSKKQCQVRRCDNFEALEALEDLALKEATAGTVLDVQIVNPMSNLPRDVIELQKIRSDIEKQLLDMENFFVSLDAQIESIRKRISESDMAREDIEHKMELAEHLSVAEGHYLCQLLRKVRRERRCYKDIGCLLQGAKLAQCNYWQNRGISQMSHQLYKRTYTPRVLPALFKKDSFTQGNYGLVSTPTSVQQKRARNTKKAFAQAKKRGEKNQSRWMSWFPSGR